MKRTMIPSLAVALSFGFQLAAANAAEVEFRHVAVEIQGTKFWVPSSLTVQEGDTVKLVLKSNVPKPNDTHGYYIEAFKVSEVVGGEEKILTFKADRAGVFPITCHLHKAHVGGQIVVLKK